MKHYIDERLLSKQNNPKRTPTISDIAGVEARASNSAYQTVELDTTIEEGGGNGGTITPNVEQLNLTFYGNQNSDTLSIDGEGSGYVLPANCIFSGLNYFSVIVSVKGATGSANVGEGIGEISTQTFNILAGGVTQNTGLMQQNIYSATLAGDFGIDITGNILTATFTPSGGVTSGTEYVVSCTMIGNLVKI